MVNAFHTAGRKPWSLRGQIILLGGLAFGTVAGAVVLGVQTLNQTEAARVGDAARQLEHGATQLSIQYKYLSDSMSEQGSTGTALAGEDDLLRALTTGALKDLPGVEGGFFAGRDGCLLGYAYPTYPGSGPKTDIPSAEMPTIARVVARAIAANGAATEEVATGSDIILFRAQALSEASHPVGAVWLMHRLTDIRGASRQIYVLGLFALLLVAGASAATAGLRIGRLGRGVGTIEMALQQMQQDVQTPVPSTGVIELDRIGNALGRLGQALHEHTIRRAALEGRLRHADRLSALGRMITGVAHEVRNPLASIKLKLQLARKGALDDGRLRDTFGVVEAEVERLDRLVERLLLLGRPVEPAPQATDIGQFIEERLAVWHARTATQGTALELLVGTQTTAPIMIDRDRLAQILDNLVANAIESLSDGGRVRVEVKRPSTSELHVTVEDTGAGVLPEVREHLFEPFFTTKEGGTGLGLFLSAELARRLGGELSYRPSPAGATRFELCLPC